MTKKETKHRRCVDCGELMYYPRWNKKRCKQCVKELEKINARCRYHRKKRERLENQTA